MRAFRLALAAFLLLAFPLAAQELGLAEAEKAALANAAALRLAFQRSQAAVRAYRFGLRDLLPRLSLAIDESQSIVMNAPDSASKVWSLTIEQPVFSGGRLLRQRALSALELALASREHSDRQDALLDAVRELFHRVLVQRRKLAILHEVRRTAEQQVRIARTERAIGSILEMDLLDAELQLSAIDLEIRSAQTLLEDYEYRLKQLIGMEPSGRLELAGDIDTSYAGIELPPDPRYFFTIALRNNTALKKQDLEVRKSREELRSLESGYLPDVDLQLILSASGPRYPLQNPGLSGKLIFSFPFRPFPLSSSISAGGTPGKTFNLGRSADAGVLQDLGWWTDRTVGLLAYRENRLKRQDLAEDLEFDIYKAIASCEQNRHAVELKRRNVELLDKKVLVMERQLELGSVKRIDYLEAQTELARERSSLVEQILQVLDGERDLERMLGVRAGGLKRIVESYPRKEPQ